MIELEKINNSDEKISIHTDISNNIVDNLQDDPETKKA